MKFITFPFSEAAYLSFDLILVGRNRLLTLNGQADSLGVSYEYTIRSKLYRSFTIFLDAYES